MSYKRTIRIHKAAVEKPMLRRLAFAGALQVKLYALDYKIIFIDEFSLSDRAFKFFGWSKKGKPEYGSSISDSFSMSFYVSLSNDRLYGIMGNEGTSASQKFISSKMFSKKEWR